MNGGTNISLAVQKAGQLLKPLGEHARRVLVLLTDGRVDSHQASGAGPDHGAACLRSGWVGRPAGGRCAAKRLS
jgi:hypothetical protein